MTGGGTGGLRRILVALDASRTSLDALSAASSLAARLGAELEGLFVEDVNVLRAAGLPFAMQVSLPSGAAQRLDRLAVEAELRALAARAREALADAARPHRIAWSFRLARGQVTVEVLGAAEDADLLVLGRSGRRAEPGSGATARAVAARATIPVLVLGEGSTMGQRLLVAYDGSSAADRALDLAAKLDAGAGMLTLLVAARTADEAERLAERARRRLGREDPVPFRWIGSEWRWDLVHASQVAGALVVVSAGIAALGGGGLERLLDELDSPVLLSR